MTPRLFILSGLAAGLTSVLALIVHARANTWNEARVSGVRLVPQLTSSSTRIGAIALGQGGTNLTLTRKGNGWVLKERNDFPVETEPVRALLVKLTQAERVEMKTRVADKFALLELEDPAKPAAKSKALRLLDDKGGSIADLVIGKRKFDAFGSNRGGTYVRAGNDPQTWLANTDIDVPLEVRRWIKPDLIALDAGKVSELKLQVAGEDPLEIERVDGKAAFKAFPPEGKKLKDAGAAEALLRALANIDIDDVRKLDAAPAGDVHMASFKTAGGLEVTLRLRREGDATWLQLTAAGEGDAKFGDTLRARTTGWEFKLPANKAEQILKKRAELIEG